MRTRTWPFQRLLTKLLSKTLGQFEVEAQVDPKTKDEAQEGIFSDYLYAFVRWADYRENPYC